MGFLKENELKKLILLLRLAEGLETLTLKGNLSTFLKSKLLQNEALQFAWLRSHDLFHIAL